MQVGQIAGPVQLPGGFSILYVIDKRKILTSDPRDALLSLKQLSIAFPAGTTQTQATAKASAFATATRKIQGCGTPNRSEEHTSELQSLMRHPYAVLRLQQKKQY